MDHDEDGKENDIEQPEMESSHEENAFLQQESERSNDKSNSYKEPGVTTSTNSVNASPSRKTVLDIGSSLALAFQTMKKGSLMTKLCRTGPPHTRYFHINASRTVLRWKSQKKNPSKTEVNVSEMLKVEEGQRSEAFKKNAKHLTADDIPRSFTLYYRAKKKNSEIRTLDVICKDEKLRSQWVEGIRYMIENKDNLLDSFLFEKKAENDGDGNDMFDSFDVYTMGSCSWGQLGHTEDVEELVDLDTPSKVKYFLDNDVTDFCSIDVGDFHMVVATTSGDVYAWGHSGSNRLGQLEREGTVFNHFLLPKRINFFKDPSLEVTQVACGACHSLFLVSSGIVYASGSNTMGQLGIGKKVECVTVVKALVPNPVRYITAGNFTSAAISTSSIECSHKTISEGEYSRLGIEDKQRLLYTWGCNLWGATGHGPETAPCFSPTEVLNATRVNREADSFRAHFSCLSVALGDFHAAAVVECVSTSDIDFQVPRTTGKVEMIGYRYLMTWGSNAQGQLGYDVEKKDSQDINEAFKSPYPRLVEYFDEKDYRPLEVSCGAAHTSLLSLRSSGSDNTENIYSEKCLHTWGLAAACTLVGETPPSNKIISPKHVEKTELYKSIGMVAAPVRRGAVIGDLFKAVSSIGVDRDSLDMEDMGKDSSVAPDFSSDEFRSIACGSIFTYILMSSGQTFLLGRMLSTSDKPIAKYSNSQIDSIAAGGENVAMLVRRKWIPDEEVAACTHCNAEFTNLRRRHHCRNCGGLFCNNCSSKRAKVLKYGFDSEVRVCDRCYNAIIFKREE